MIVDSNTDAIQSIRATTTLQLCELTRYACKTYILYAFDGTTVSALREFVEV